jgi:hypothetical protein
VEGDLDGRRHVDLLATGGAHLVVEYITVLPDFLLDLVLRFAERAVVLEHATTSY